jgi:hypothetical protein
MKIKTIDINAREWFDKINGNSYFSGDITLNYGAKTQKDIKMPFQYGYGEQYIQESYSRLIKDGYILESDSNISLSRYCRDKNIILRTNKQENCKKRDL